MSCRIPYDKLQTLFTKSLAFDRSTYRFYRNYIKSVMNMPIVDEAKVHAIWFGGLSYNDALNYEEDIVTEGLPAAISNLVFGSLNSTSANYTELLNGIIEILEGKPAAPVSDVITDEVYNDFVDKNIVPYNVLNSIADKVIARTSLSERETAIFSSKTSEVNEIIRAKAPTPKQAVAKTTVDLINDTLASLRKVDSTGILSTLDKFNDIISSARDLSDAQKIEAYDKFKEVLNTKPQNSNKAVALANIDARISELDTTQPTTGLIDFGRIPGIGLDIYSIRVHSTGEVFEAIRLNNAYFKVTPEYNGTNPEVLEEYTIQPLDYIKALYSQKINIGNTDNSGRYARVDINIVQNGVQFADVRVYPLGVTEEQSLDNATGNERISKNIKAGTSVLDQVQIIADRRMANLNMQRILNLRSRGYDVSFENTLHSNQIKYLQDNPDGVVVNFLKSKTQIDLIISDLSGENWDYITGLDSLGFVFADGTTKLVDWNNPSDLALLQSNLTYRKWNETKGRLEYVQVTPSDIESMHQAVKKLKELKEEIVENVLGDADSAVVPKELISKYYDIANTFIHFPYLELEEGKKALKAATPLATIKDQLVPTGSTIKATIAQVRLGKVLPETAREVDVMGIIYKGADGLSFSDSIPKGFAIVDENFNIINDPYNTLFTEAGLNLEKLAKTIEKPENAFFYLVRFKDTWSARPMVRNAPISSQGEIVNFISALSGLRDNRPAYSNDPESKKMLVEMIQQFNNQGWGFNVTYGLSPTIDHLGTFNVIEPVYGIKLRAQPGYPLADKFNEKNLTIEFSFDYNEMEKWLGVIYNDLGITKPDFSDIDQRITFGEQLESKLNQALELQILSPEAQKALENIVANYKESHDNIYKVVETIVKDHAKYEQENNDKYIADTDEFIYSLFENLNGTGIKIRSNFKSADPIDRYKVFESTLETGNVKKLTFVQSNPRVFTGGTINTLTPTVSSPTPSITAPDPNQAPAVKQITRGKRKLFSLVNTLKGLSKVSDEAIAAEVNEVRRMLGNSLKEVVEKDLTDEDVNGTVLGYFEDQVIYLNSKLRIGGVLYHEAFHSVFRTSLANEERRVYLDAVAKITGGIRTDEKGKHVKINGKKVYLNKFRLDRKYSGVADEIVADYIYEEYMADGFRDYKLNNKEPKNTILKFLYKLMDRIINLFTNKGYKAAKEKLRGLYQDIDNGKYASVVGDIYQAPRAYELSYIPTSVSTSGSVSEVPVDVKTYNQLSDRIVAELLARSKDIIPNDQKSFDEVYDDVTAQLIDYYNIDRFIDQSNPLYQQARAKYEPAWRAMRYMMGSLHRPEFNETFILLNESQDRTFDNYRWNSSNEDAIDGSLTTYNEVKEYVLKMYNSIGFMEDTTSEEDENSRENSEDSVDQDFEESNDESSVGERYDDEGITSFKPYDGSKEFQKLIRFIKYEAEDAEFGFSYIKTVDSRNVINTIRKITANVPKERIIESIVQQISQMRTSLIGLQNSGVLDQLNYIPNNYTNLSDQYWTLKAVYDALSHQAGLNENLRVTRKSGEAFYNMFHDVFYYAQKDVVAVNIDTDYENDLSDDEKKELKREGISAIKNGYTVSNLIQKHDIQIVMNNLKENVNTMLNNIAALPVTIPQLIEQLNNFNYEPPINAQEFIQTVHEIYRLTSLGKLDIPFNIIEFAVAADVKENRGNKGSFVDHIINNNKKFYDDKNYFDPKLLLISYKGILESYNKTGIDSKISKFLAIYKPVIPFQVKYEPGLTGTTVLNQDGKPISQFVPYVPSIQILSDIKDKGMRQALTDIYGSTDWFSNNPWLRIGMSDVQFNATRQDVAAKKEDNIRTFLNNLDITIAGGLYQNFEGSQLKSTFRRMGDKGYVLSVLGMFANRKTVKGSYNQNVELFNRPITQLEATSTQFNITGIYSNYNTKESNQAIVSGFKAVLKQEFERIKREWSTKDDPTKKLIKDYNSITLDDGTVITDDTTSDTKLRAYTFNNLMDFFDSNEETKRLRGMLIDGAKSGKTFDEVLELNPEQSQLLNTELLAYGERSVTSFYNYLISINIGYDDIPMLVRKGKTKEDIIPLTKYKETEEGVERKETETEENKDLFIRDFVYNYWFNGFFINQLFDGDLAVGIKGFIDYFKRQKSGVAAGSNYRNVNIPVSEDVTRTAVFKTLKGYLDQEDPSVPVTTTSNGGEEVKIADGQAWTTIDRRIKKYRKDGLLSPRLESILLKMRYAEATPEEVQMLIDNDLILTSGKPVGAHPYYYIKDSEHYINRTDMSYVSDPAEAARLYAILDGIDFTDQRVESNPNQLYKDTIREIHALFTPKKGREFMHHLLNSMEYHRIDVVFDEESSKKATSAPLVLNIALIEQGVVDGPLAEDHITMMRPGSELGIKSVEDGYINLEYSKQDIPNSFFYDQVATKSLKTENTDAIQKKLLLPAQLDPKEFPLVTSIANTQEEIAVARLNYLQTLFKTNSPSALITKAINDGLLSQGAGANLLKYYSLNQEGQNNYNLNLPVLGKTPLYYFFSVFNNNLYGPKIAGKKFFHVSNLGYKIVVDENNNPVPRSLLDAFPEAYANYATRYPTVIEEFDDAGKLKRIVVEVIVPKEIASNPDDVAFFEELYTEFLATRIPTEDKRSMIVAKVVDTIDASYGNSIIVPSQVHKWAGSDLDIDALYADTYDHYRNIRGQLIKYGDYSLYQSEYGLSPAEARFVEYLHFVSQDPALREKIDAETEKQVNVLGHRFLSIQDMAGEFGPKLSSFFRNTTSPEIERLNIQSEINNLTLEKKGFYDENKLLRENIRLSTITQEKSILREQIKSNEQQILGLDLKISALESVLERRYSWEEIKKTNDLNTLMTRLVTVINVLKDNQLPATLSEFNSFVAKFGNPVTPTLQNKVLDYKKNLLADPRVYEKYIKNANADSYISAYKEDKRLVEGISEFVGVDKSNPFLFETVAKVRSLNNGSKDMLGANASQNKGAALISSSMIKLKPEYTHKFKYNGKSIITNTPSQQAVQLVGGAIGVSADDGKNQLLGPLRLNRNNSAVVNALYIYGYPAQFARLISSVDLIADAIKNYKLNDDPSYSRSRGFRMSFGTSLRNTLNRYLTKGVKINGIDYQKELDTLGVLIPNAQKKDLYNVDLSKVTIEFNDVTGEGITGQQPSDMNIKVRYGRNQIMPDALASVVLMSFYNNMLEVGNAISFKVATVTNVYKQIKPDFASLTKIKEATQYLREDNPIFLNSNKIFTDNPGLKVLVEDGIDTMIDKSKQVLLDQTDLFAAITNMFKYDKNISPDEVVVQLKSILAMSAFNAYMDKKIPSLDLDNLSAEDSFLYAIYEATKLEYWTDNQAIADLKLLKKRFPDNTFLQSLADKPANYSGKSSINVITSVIGNKVTPEKQDNLINDFYQLLYVEDIDVYNAIRRVAFHGILKDGGIAKREGYLKLLAPEMFKFISERLDDIQKGMYKIDTTDRKKLETYLGGLDELFRNVYNLPKSTAERGTDSQRVLQAILTKLVSTLTQQVTGNRNLSMSFFPGNEQFPTAGKFSDIKLKIFARIVNTILPKNKELIYTDVNGNIQSKRPERIKYIESLGMKPSKTRFDLWQADNNGEVFFDLTDIQPELTEEVNRIIRAQGIVPRNDEYAFPLYQINNFEQGQLFIISEIDGKPFNQEFFKNLFDAYKNNEEFEYLLRGKTVKYKLVQRQGVDRILPNAFTNKVATELHRASTGKITAAERKMGILPLPTGVKFINNSSHVAVSSKDLANELAGGNWRYQNMDYAMTTPVRYSTSTNARFKDVVFVNGKPAQESQLEEFAHKSGFANFNAMKADPRMSGWLSSTKKDNAMWMIPYTATPIAIGEVVDIVPTAEPVPQAQAPASVSTGFQGYKGGFEDKGKGTFLGDGKDKAMRQVAEGFIGELASEAELPKESPYDLRSINSKTSTGFSFKTIGIRDGYSQDYYHNGPTVSSGKLVTTDDMAKVVMLARNGELKGKPLAATTKESILNAHEDGAEFVVGDMPGVDSQFIDYLQEIGAKFTVYHTGNKSRIQVTRTSTQPVAPIAQPAGEYQIVNQTSSVKEGTFIYIPDKKGKIVDYKVIKVLNDKITVKNQVTNKEKTFTEEEYRQTFNQPSDIGFSISGEKGLAEVYNTGLKTVDGKQVYSLEVNLFDDADKGKGFGKDIYKAAIAEITNRNGVLTPGNVVDENKVWSSFERDGLTKTVKTTTGDDIIVYADSAKTDDWKNIDNDSLNPLECL